VAELAPEDSSTGVGYRLRYLAPPWERFRKDPLATDAPGAGFIASEQGLTAFEKASVTVLEVERTSVSTGSNIISYPTYRLEVGFVRCAASMLGKKGVCSDLLAAAESLKLDASDQVFFGAGGRVSANDFDQRFVDVLTRNLETLRYRRLAYFDTVDPTLVVRLGLEANPSLNEREVTRMIEAFEVLETASSAGGSAGSPDAGAP
jgi:hypothetical protein